MFEVFEERAIEYIRGLLNKRVISQAELARKLNVSPQYISRLIKESNKGISENSIRRIIALYPDAKSYIFDAPGELAPNARLKADTTEKMLVPLVHERARAGFSDMWSDREWIEDLPTVSVNKRTDGVYICFEIVGDSMLTDSPDALIEGDEILAREVYKSHWLNKLHIPDVFVIALKNDGIIIKEIIKHDTTAGLITAHSWNDMFPDQEINLGDVVKLYHYKELVRRKWRGRRR